MKNKKRKSLFTALALVILSGIASVGSTFAWWNTFRVDKSIKISVGDRVALTLTTTGNILEEGKQLVPSDVNPLANQVTEVTVKTSLTVTGDNINLNELNLEVSEVARQFAKKGEDLVDLFDINETPLNSELANYFTVKIDTQEIRKSDNNNLIATIEDIESSFDVDIKFTLVVSEEDRDGKEEALAADLAKGTFEIALSFELVNKL